MIKPEFFTDRKLSRLSIPARLLFIGLWTLADRDGRLVNAPNMIGGAIFPYDSGIDFSGLIGELVNLHLIECYVVEGEGYIQIKNFTKHQKPHPKEKGSVIPCNLHGSAVEKVESIRADTGIRNTDTGIQVALSPNGSEHKALIEFWMSECERTTGIKYLFQAGKDGATIKRVLTQLKSLELAKVFVADFFQNPDDFVLNKSGFTIGVFATQLNKIAQRLSSTRREGESETDRFNRLEAEKYMKQFDKDGNRVEPTRQI